MKRHPIILVEGPEEGVRNLDSTEVKRRLLIWGEESGLKVRMWGGKGVML